MNKEKLKELYEKYELTPDHFFKHQHYTIITRSGINASIRVDKLPKEKFIKGKDGAVYYNLTISLNDETRYGNNVAIMDSQTKEEREAKAQRNYLGNGKVVWHNEIIKLAEKEAVVETVANDDLPF